MTFKCVLKASALENNAVRQLHVALKCYSNQTTQKPQTTFFNHLLSLFCINLKQKMCNSERISMMTELRFAVTKKSQTANEG